MRVCGRTKSIPESTGEKRRGVRHVPEGTEAEGMKPLRTSEDNRARSHDHQARRSAGHRGREDGRQEA